MSAETTHVESNARALIARWYDTLDADLMLRSSEMMAEYKLHVDAAVAGGADPTMFPPIVSLVKVFEEAENRIEESMQEAYSDLCDLLEKTPGWVDK